MPFSFRNPQPTARPQDKQVAPESDRALRQSCVLWALHDREVSGVKNRNILNAAQEYYDFITGRRQEWLDMQQKVNA
jgi:hypothetical protein